MSQSRIGNYNLDKEEHKKNENFLNKQNGFKFEKAKEEFINDFFLDLCSFSFKYLSKKDFQNHIDNVIKKHSYKK